MKGPEPSPGVKVFLGYAIAPENQQVVEQARVAEATKAPTTEPSPAATIAPEATSPNGAVSPQATVSPDTAFVPPGSGIDTVSNPVPWWGWWLSIPLLGGVLWWLLKDQGAGALAGAPLAAAAATGDPASRIILVPRNCRDAYAYWEVPEATHADLQRQGGEQLAVRLYDVTDINLDHQNPHSVQQFNSDGQSPDLHLPIQVDDRDYIAELGYVTHDNRWLKIARSEHVRVPACVPTGDGFQPAARTTTQPFSAG
ncbi:DUF4912 domain-containing protein [Kovacikia minuta CCNUW1]|uniref:DUF4912 domain-containing protein n=1 Tax=Kovacikia minuta TaxID=2931930 RepID=UPI001CCAF806|nr:DUF4912 domain-containing protein [Kovacikia minuta]UBF26352.1 DUF4912 domain-containing protein [Kovacikia minuta CCNUW1]